MPRSPCSPPSDSPGRRCPGRASGALDRPGARTRARSSPRRTARGRRADGHGDGVIEGCDLPQADVDLRTEGRRLRADRTGRGRRRRGGDAGAEVPRADGAAAADPPRLHAGSGHAPDNQEQMARRPIDPMLAGAASKAPASPQSRGHQPSTQERGHVQRAMGDDRRDDRVRTQPQPGEPGRPPRP